MFTNEKCPNCDGRGTESDGADREEVECWQCKGWRKITVEIPSAVPPPSPQPQEATPASPMRFELYHDVIWYGYIGDSTVPAYSIAHESDGDWCVYPCINGESGHIFKSPDLEQCKQYLMHNEALSQPYYVVIEEIS